MQGSVLRYRIARAAPWRAQAGCAFALGVGLTLLGGGIVALAFRHGDRGLPLIVGGAFALVGLLLLYSGIHQLIASRVPETVFELEDLPLFRGKTRAGVIIQDGPVTLQSLRANLVCLEHRIEIVRRKGKNEKNRFTKQVWDANVLDVGAIDMPAGERLQWGVYLDVPPDAEPTHSAANREIEWRVEVWGRVAGRPDFMHPFVVEVR